MQKQTDRLSLSEKGSKKSDHSYQSNQSKKSYKSVAVSHHRKAINIKFGQVISKVMNKDQMKRFCPYLEKNFLTDRLDELSYKVWSNTGEPARLLQVANSNFKIFTKENKKAWDSMLV